MRPSFDKYETLYKRELYFSANSNVWKPKMQYYYVDST